MRGFQKCDFLVFFDSRDSDFVVFLESKVRGTVGETNQEFQKEPIQKMAKTSQKITQTITFAPQQWVNPISKQTILS